MILPDFQNLYTNKSYLSREQQIRQFRMMLEMIQEHIPDIDKRNMQISLHGLLYSILSETTYGECVFMAANILSSQLLSVYLEQLRPDNILVTTELVENMDYRSDEFVGVLKDYLDALQKELPKKFTIMVFPYKMLEGNFVMWQKYIFGILAYQGRIIIYDCPDRVSVTDDFFLITDHAVGNGFTIKMLQTKKAFVASDINIAMSQKARKLHENIISFIDNKEETNSKIDGLIYEAWTLEKKVIEYRDEFTDGDMKYKLSDIKNALLDLRYSDEADREFFLEALRKETDIIPSLISHIY